MSQRKAIEAEATATEVLFEHKGSTYRIPPNPDLDVLEHWEDGNYVKAIRTLLGKDQWAEYKKETRSMADFGELLEDAMSAMGTTPGESPA